MKEYNVVSVLWDDHTGFHRTKIIKNPEKLMRPTLTIGFIYRQTDKTMTVVSELERYDEGDEATYVVIFKSTIRAVTEYGKIKLAVNVGA